MKNQKLHLDLLDPLIPQLSKIINNGLTYNFIFFDDSDFKKKLDKNTLIQKITSTLDTNSPASIYAKINENSIKITLEVKTGLEDQITLTPLEPFLMKKELGDFEVIDLASYIECLLNLFENCAISQLYNEQS
jgi:hypothetical protein